MSDSSRIFFDRSPLGPLWEIIFAKTCLSLAFGGSQAAFAMYC